MDHFFSENNVKVMVNNEVRAEVRSLENSSEDFCLE